MTLYQKMCNFIPPTLSEFQRSQLFDYLTYSGDISAFDTKKTSLIGFYQGKEYNTKIISIAKNTTSIIIMLR